jgi:carbon monoxide dehydrogenase subunit G
MKRRGFILLLVLVLLGNALACSAIGGPSKGSGKIIKGEIAVNGFSGVTLATAGNLYIEVGSVEELRIEVDDNLLQQFDVSVDSKMLTIKLKDGAKVEPTKDVNFYLTVEELDTIVLTGSGEVEVKSAGLRADQFSVTMSGSGDVTMAGLNASSLDVNISGSGTLEIASGYVDEQTVVISGSGEYEAQKLQSANASVEISGSGSATVWAVRELAVTGAGSGSVEYAGTPKLSTEGSVSVKPVSD